MGYVKEVCPYNAIAEVMRPCKKACPTEHFKWIYKIIKATINKKKSA